MGRSFLTDLSACWSGLHWEDSRYAFWAFYIHTFMELRNRRTSHERSLFYSK